MREDNKALCYVLESERDCRVAYEAVKVGLGGTAVSLFRQLEDPGKVDLPYYTHPGTNAFIDDGMVQLAMGEVVSDNATAEETQECIEEVALSIDKLARDQL